MTPEPFNVLVQTANGPMLVNKNDIYVGGSFLAYGEFSHGETVLFEALIKPGMVVFNAGANIGAHTVRLAQLCAPGACYAFEPQPIAFQTLCANVALNSLVNVVPRQKCVGATGWANIKMLDPYARQNFGGLEVSTDEEHAIPVEVLAIDQLMLPQLDFLMADVEGMELDVIQGARETIERCLPILYVEADRKEKQPALLAALTDLGYAAYWHTPPLFRADNPRNNPEDIFGNVVSINWLCLPENRALHPSWQRVTEEAIR